MAQVFGICPLDSTSRHTFHRFVHTLKIFLPDMLRMALPSRKMTCQHDNPYKLNQEWKFALAGMLDIVSSRFFPPRSPASEGYAMLATTTNLGTACETHLVTRQAPRVEAPNGKSICRTFHAIWWIMTSASCRTDTTHRWWCALGLAGVCYCPVGTLCA